MNELSDAQNYMFILTMLLGLFSGIYIVVMAQMHDDSRWEYELMKRTPDIGPLSIMVAPVYHRIERYRSYQILDRELEDDERYLEHVKRNMIRGIADGIEPYIDITYDRDLYTGQKVLQMELKIAVKE